MCSDIASWTRVALKGDVKFSPFYIPMHQACTWYRIAARIPRIACDSQPNTPSIMASRRIRCLANHLCDAHTDPNAAILAGIRVVELSTMAAAPAAAAVLADLGATVIKVESPAGDPWRKTGVKYRPEVEFGVMVSA
jgi:hypothetical protein